MKLKTLILGPFMFCVLWFVGWEAYSVWDARQKTDAIFQDFRSDGRQQTAWDDLAPERQQILLKVEDPKYWTHRGVDFETHGAGLSTITQVIARQLYFEKFTPGFSEIEQSLIAFFVIDPQIDKALQLDVFLNVAGFGRHNGAEVSGFDPAARVFFGKALRDLTRSEFIELVAMRVEPDRYARGTAASRKRVARIERFLAGKCGPVSRRDVLYETC